jgi:hypothetical protein
MNGGEKLFEGLSSGEAEARLYGDEYLEKVTCGNREAAQWLRLGREYVHLFDDIVDEGCVLGVDLQTVERTKHAVIRMAGMALELYTHPWFRRYSDFLMPVMLLANVNYGDSVAWEGADEKWKREASDWIRHGWLEAVKMTAYLCGGYEHTAQFSRACWEIAYRMHHDEKGLPV